MEDLQSCHLVNTCDTIGDLKVAIMALADSNGNIQGRNRSFNAEKMALAAQKCYEGDASPNTVTRMYGLRQQLLYIMYYSGKLIYRG